MSTDSSKCKSECCDYFAVHPSSSELSLKDKLDGCKVRWGINRMGYTVEPGIYGIGNPSEDAPVLVTANYKLTFDAVRKELAGLDCYVLVLDTKGVNVWCAAGKGTFGTDELVSRIKAVRLPDIVTHKKLIVPQLGAPGVDGREVKRQTGFAVEFGPVRASDIKAFISAGSKASGDMREVKFTLRDRLAVVPIELVLTAKIALVVFGILLLINLVAQRPFGVNDFLLYISSIVVGAVVVPALLPFIPGRAFAFKGWLLGIFSTVGILWAFGWLASPFLLLAAGYILVLPAHSAFIAMNFTGASTYTSPSGVLKEMKTALPLIVFSTVVGIILLLIKAFIG